MCGEVWGSWDLGYSWKPLPAPWSAKYDHAAVYVGDRVLVVGGGTFPSQGVRGAAGAGVPRLAQRGRPAHAGGEGGDEQPKDEGRGKGDGEALAELQRRLEDAPAPNAHTRRSRSTRAAGRPRCFDDGVQPPSAQRC